MCIRLTRCPEHRTRSGNDGWKTDRVFHAATPAKDALRCVLIASRKRLLLIEPRGECLSWPMPAGSWPALTGRIVTMPDEADEEALARDMIEVHGVEAS